VTVLVVGGAKSTDGVHTTALASSEIFK